MDIGENLAIPLAFFGGEGLVKGIAAVKGLEKVGAIAQGVGDFMQRVATADPTDPFGRFMALAAENSAPGWMREVAKAPAVQLAVTAGRLGGAAAVGAAKAGALGAAVGAASGDNAEEIGQNVSGFGLFGAIHGGLNANEAAILQRNLGNVTKFVQGNLDANVSPETLRLVPADVVMTAATAEHLYPDWSIRFGTASDPASIFAKGKTGFGQAGVTDYSTKTIWIDPTMRNAQATLLHELQHPIFDTLVNRQPEIVDTIDKALQASGKTIDDFKREYAASSSLVMNLPRRSISRTWTQRSRPGRILKSWRKLPSTPYSIPTCGPR